MNSPNAISHAASSFLTVEVQEDLASEFYISRHGKIHGPCSLDEIRSYLAYGSMKAGERVCRAGCNQWVPVGELPELRPPDAEPEIFENAPGWLQWLRPMLRIFDKGSAAKNAAAQALALAPRRRVVRYRDYEKVPEQHRAGATALRIFFGFLFFPPRLWSACATVFSQRIYRNRTDEAGYLRTWPRWVEMFCAVLLTVNALAWIFAIYWVVDTAFPVAHESLDTFLKITREWWSELGKHPNG